MHVYSVVFLTSYYTESPVFNGFSYCSDVVETTKSGVLVRDFQFKS